MENLAKAIIAVMTAVKGIEKSMTVGTGSSSYKGVPDKEVKKAYNEAMAANGLCILPIEVDAKTTVSRWEEMNSYKELKQKQSVFTEVTTKYLLLHTSGESQVISGYGHGVDAQDKGAGKATTYALKYTLLYTFLTPTGTIDDADNDHNDNKETPAPNSSTNNQEDQRPWLDEKLLNQAIARINKGEFGVYDKIDKAFRMKKQYREQLKNHKPTLAAV